ncbi:MAG: ATP-binding protein [Labilithrix sp.]|nr:ATP-binding protein [Labilithrix sp.]
MKILDVKVEKDHLEKLAVGRKLSAALSELIWNALDADARDVRVDYISNGLGGISEITVVDDAPLGMPYERALVAFGKLGGSWKKSALTTPTEGRALHGKEGIGRFRAFALGDHIEWRSVYATAEGKRAAYVVTGKRSQVQRFTVDDPKPTTASAGTVVTVANTSLKYDSFHRDEILQELSEHFALYLKRYAHVRITYGAKRVDPNAFIEREEDWPLAVGDDDDATLTVIEWKSNASRALVLCDQDGFGLVELPPLIQAPGFNFTAYLRSPRLTALHADRRLELSELDPAVKAYVEAAKEKLRGYFKKRALEKKQDEISAWKAQDVYPFAGEPKTPLDAAERQVFDIVALNVARHVPDFEKTDLKSKKFAFRLLRQALEDSPEAVQTIMTDVLELPKEKQEDLAALLKKTTLTAIITASKVIADRLDFLRGLEMLVFDKLAKRTVLERKELHRVIAQNTWIFGEEFHLAADDQPLEEVLAKHRLLLGPVSDEKEHADEKDSAGGGPVVMDDGRRGIVDLMLSKRIPLPKNEEREHLVVELKRPLKKIDIDVTTQVEKYAMAVARDERFANVRTSWTFWALSNEVTEDVRIKARQGQRPDGILLQTDSPRITIWVRTWAQVIDAAKARLEFFRSELEYTADRESAREHLNKVYAKYLPDVLRDGPDASTTDGVVESVDTDSGVESVDAPGAASAASDPTQLTLDGAPAKKRRARKKSTSASSE